MFLSKPQQKYHHQPWRNLIVVVFDMRMTLHHSPCITTTQQHNNNSGLEGSLVVTAWSFWGFSSVSSTMPSIASDSEELDLACTMTAIGNPSISRVPVPCFYSSTSSRYIWIVLPQCAGCSPMSQTQNSLFKNYTLCSDLPSCFTQGQVSHALVKVMLCSMFCNRNSSSCFYSGLIGFLRNSKSW